MGDIQHSWWSEEYDFFGDFYMEGDNSCEGYLAPKKQQDLRERTEAEVGGIINLLKLSQGDSVLDVPCGYGRHSIELAKRGIVVTGSDLNGTHLEEAIKDSQGIAGIRFVKENMIDLRYTDEFDAVINMFYSFGFFETDEENEKVLVNFYNALKSGGRFLMHTDVNVPMVLSGKYKSHELRQLQDGKTLEITDTYDSATKRMNGVWVIRDKEGHERRKDYSVRVYTKDEFIELCQKVGFKSGEAYSDWNGKPYSEDSDDMIIVATK